jgi:hypothetical protein
MDMACSGNHGSSEFGRSRLTLLITTTLVPLERIGCCLLLLRQQSKPKKQQCSKLCRDTL